MWLKRRVPWEPSAPSPVPSTDSWDRYLFRVLVYLWIICSILTRETLKVSVIFKFSITTYIAIITSFTRDNATRKKAIWQRLIIAACRDVVTTYPSGEKAWLCMYLCMRLKSIRAAIGKISIGRYKLYFPSSHYKFKLNLKTLCLRHTRPHKQQYQTVIAASI